MCNNLFLESAISLVNGEIESESPAVVTQNHSEGVVKENGDTTPMEMDAGKAGVFFCTHDFLIIIIVNNKNAVQVERVESTEEVVSKNKEADASNGR